MPEQLSLYFEGLEELSQEDQAAMQKKYEGILEHLDEIDGELNEYSQGWKTSRMNRVDLTALRLAVYEMKFDEDIPTGVAINEAVELAKRFGGEDSGSFVNGILGKIASGKKDSGEIHKTRRPSHQAKIIIRSKKIRRIRNQRKARTEYENNLFRRPGKPLCKKYVCAGFRSEKDLCQG